MPSFITVGYVRQILWRGVHSGRPTREQPWKGLSCIELMIRENLIDVVKRFTLTRFSLKRGMQGIFRDPFLIWKSEFNIKIFQLYDPRDHFSFSKPRVPTLTSTFLQKCFIFHLEHFEQLIITVNQLTKTINITFLQGYLSGLDRIEQTFYLFPFAQYFFLERWGIKSTLHFSRKINPILIKVYKVVKKTKKIADIIHIHFRFNIIVRLQS